MTRKINLEYFGMDGEGTTVKEAKLDAGRKLESLVREVGTPIIIGPCGDYSALMWRDRFGWAYALMVSGQYELCAHHSANKDECYNSAASHLAQVGCDQDEVMCVADVPEFVTDRRERMELVRYMRWQRAARHARFVLGMTDAGLIHSWACQHDTEFTNKKSSEVEVGEEIHSTIN